MRLNVSPYKHKRIKALQKRYSIAEYETYLTELRKLFPGIHIEPPLEFIEKEEL